MTRSHATRNHGAARGLAARAGQQLAAGALALALLAGCATPPMTAELLRSPAALPAAPVRLQVPFFAQADYQCGPAALAMLLAADGSAVTPEELVPQVYLPAREGALQAEMLATARRHGRLAVVLPPRLEALLATVAAGLPVVVLQNLALPLAPRWHYAVVIGFDRTRQAITLHSGTTAAVDLSLAVFERTWARGGHWAMTAAAPERLPVGADDAALLAAAVALEHVDAGAAARAYAAIVARSPALAGAWFGLGNARHSLGDLAGAEQGFFEAARIDPHLADAWHNLALTRLARGRAAEALAAARQAAALGGVRADRYRATLEAIERAAQHGGR